VCIKKKYKCVYTAFFTSHQLTYGNNYEFVTWRMWMGEERLEDEKLKLLITSIQYTLLSIAEKKYFLFDLLPIAHYQPQKQQHKILCENLMSMKVIMSSLHSCGFSSTDNFLLIHILTVVSFFYLPYFVKFLLFLSLMK
jgi:hypothetical protein